MNREIKNIFRWFLVLIIQVGILNKVNLGGYINPQIYIMYVILFNHYQKSKMFFVISSFALGLSVDFFMNSGGINAFAITIIAYFRTDIFRLIMGTIDKENRVSLRDYPFLKVANYIIVMVLIHHSALFWMENFSFNGLSSMISRIILSSIFTGLISLATLSLILKKQ